MNILTIDVEDWFHILDNPSTKTVNEWGNFESRLEASLDKILPILEESNTRATFFCLGWIAEKHPHIIRHLNSKGYEVGSHTHYHQLAYEQSPSQFKADVDRSIKTLEDITGEKVKSFRAPGFSITEHNKWAFEILVELGIEFDSSIFPTARAHGGYQSFQHPKPSLLDFNGHFIKEFPINYAQVLSKQLVFAGGGYFRLFPYALIKRWTKQLDYVMAYLHPRDFDFGQPMLDGLPVSRKFKSYVGLKQALPKFERWVNDFKFVDLKAADKLIDWRDAPIVKL